MTEQDFVLLDTLARVKNITQTARLLHITQPAITRRIQLLEEELETPLLIRSRRGICFTPEGEIALKASRDARDIMLRLRRELADAKGSICGTLHAGISMNYAQHYLPAILRDFRRLYPLVTSQINVRHSWVLYNSLMAGDYDLAILPGEHPWPGEKKAILHEQVYAVMDSGYRDCPLEHIPYISRQTDSFFERNAARWLEENRISPSENCITINHTTACLEMVRHGLGWAIIPQCCLQDFDGIMRPLYFSDGTPFTRTTYLFYTQKSFELPQVRVFIEEINRGMTQGDVSACTSQEKQTRKTPAVPLPDTNRGDST